MSNLEYTKCSLCGADEKNLLIEAMNIHGCNIISNERFNLVKCRYCGLVYINPRPAESEIERFYDINYYRPNSGLKLYLEKIITGYSNSSKKKLITKYKKKGKLLDIGCGTGNFLSAFNSAKWDLYGIEPNSSGFNISSKRVKGKVFNNDLAACKLQNNYFDVISMWHVFEHVYNPNRELQEIKRVLNDSGVLIIGIPNVKSFGFSIGKKYWFHLDAPRHLYHYNHITIVNMLIKNGFEIADIIYPAFEYPLDLYHTTIAFIGRNKFIKILFFIPVLIASFILKGVFYILKVSETFTVICKMKG